MHYDRNFRLSSNHDEIDYAACVIKLHMRKKIKRPVELLSSAVLIAVCCGGRAYGIMPFGAPVFLSLADVFIGFTAPLYLLCEFLFSFELWRLYIAGAVIFIAALRWFLGLKIARFGRENAKMIFSVGAIIAHAALSVLFRPAVECALTGVIGVVFYFFARRTAFAALHKFSFRLGAADAAAVCAVLAVFGLSLGGATVYGFNVGLALLYFTVLMLSVAGVKSALAGGIAVSFGLAVSAGVETALAFCLCTAAAVAFRTLARPLYAVAGIGVFAAASILFAVDPLSVGYGSAMMAIGGAMFCAVPRRTVKALGAYFDFDGSARLAVRHYINRSKADAGNRMLAVATVFDETARLMNAFPDAKPDYTALGMSLSDKICPYCKNNALCDKARAGAAFASVAESACSGRPVIAELPDFFSKECVRAAEVLGYSADIAAAAKERERVAESDEKARAVITERLAAVKDVLADLGASQASPVGFDGTAEERIAVELSNVGVECAEVFVTRDGVTAVVRTATAKREAIRRAVSACLKCDCAVTSLEKSQAAGWSIATLKRRPAFEAAYARAGAAKSGVSGDSYTFERIDDKFLVALLDGMGSGAEAGLGSDAAVELIECFYKAGFDSQSVLTGVNRFMKLPNNESYSAADVVICDLETANVDIIKIGAPPCYIKTADTVLKIEGSSLPIGVLDEMRPYSTAKRLYPGQMLILVTDGVSDCFSGDELPQFINGLTAFNPETVSGKILQRALDLSGGTPKDDMTVIAFRLFDAPKKRAYKRVSDAA